MNKNWKEKEINGNDIVQYMGKRVCILNTSDDGVNFSVLQFYNESFDQVVEAVKEDKLTNLSFQDHGVVPLAKAMDITHEW